MSTKLDSAMSVIRFVIPDLKTKKILEIGCGNGALAAAMVADGAIVTGIDPNPIAIEQAKLAAPAAEFVQTGAEALPFGNESFDAVVTVNALHHVPVEVMYRSLQEAARVMRPDGQLIVMEPLAEGNFFEALRMIEDETEVRHAAQAALARAAKSGLFVPERGLGYQRREVFENADHFLRRVVAVVPSRAAFVEANHAAVTEAILKAAARDESGKLVLDQPIKVDVFRKMPS